ncbi:MAG: hypothetical protein ABII88_01965 [Candidatus Omnitrophota bacterium]
MKRILSRLVLVTVLIYCANVFASPVDLPYCLKALTVERITENQFSLSAEMDMVSERNMKELSSDIAANFGMLKLTYSTPYAIDFYGMYGQAYDVEYSYGANKFNLADTPAWGFGVNMAIFIDELEDLGVWPFIDFKYREITDMGYESFNSGTISYTGSAITSANDAEWRETQLALGIIKNFDMCVFYIGGKYSNADASAKLSAGGTTYELMQTHGKSNVGVFLGFLIPTEKFKVGLEGRFVDEKALSVNFTYKF